MTPHLLVILIKHVVRFFSHIQLYAHPTSVSAPCVYNGGVLDKLCVFPADQS